MTDAHEEILIDSVKKLANAVLEQTQQIRDLQYRLSYLEQMLKQTEANRLMDDFNRPYEG